MKKQFPNEEQAYIYVVQQWSIPKPECSSEHSEVKDPETEGLRTQERVKR